MLTLLILGTRTFSHCTSQYWVKYTSRFWQILSVTQLPCVAGCQWDWKSWLILPLFRTIAIWIWFAIFWEDSQSSSSVRLSWQCTLYSLFTYYDDDVIIHIIALVIIIIIWWPLSWGGTPWDRWELPLLDCFMLHNSPAILSLYGDGLLFEQRQPDHNLSAHLVAIYHQSSLPVLPGPNYLWSWQFGLTCLVMNATITIKSFALWNGKATGVLVGQKFH